MAENNAPSAEKILSILIELFADQYGVKIDYEIVDGDQTEKEVTALCQE